MGEVGASRRGTLRVGVLADGEADIGGDVGGEMGGERGLRGRSGVVNGVAVVSDGAGRRSVPASVTGLTEDIRGELGVGLLGGPLVFITVLGSTCGSGSGTLCFGVDWVLSVVSSDGLTTISAILNDTLFLRLSG